MDIKELAQQYEPYIIDRRRHYHACPELSGEEVNTTRQLAEDLQKMGVEVTLMKQHHGLTGLIRGARPGKTIALRSDIDGLKLEEQTGLPFASTNGNMHGCGHDNHMAMLLGAAKILTEIKGELSGNVKLIFQPAEEIAMGAKWMLEEGVMDGVDAIYGAHIWGDFDAPCIDVTPGFRMAGCHLFDIDIYGKSAHGSAPSLGIDAITISAAVINNLQQYVSRMNNPTEPLVLTIGTIQGGERFNVIPDHVHMDGTLRTFKEGDESEKIIRRIIESTCAAFGAKGVLDYRYMTVPVTNSNEQLNRLAHDAVVKLYGESGIGHLPTLMGSEDFSWFGQNTPYIFGFIGSRNAAKGEEYTHTNHEKTYTVDEDVLKRGSAFMAQFAHDYLAETARQG